MRSRYADRTTGRRVRVFTNDVKALCRIDNELTNDGFTQVSFVGFLVALVFPKKKVRPNGDE